MAKKKQKFSGLADFLDEDQPGQIIVEFNELDEKTKKTIELQEKFTDIPVADRPVNAFQAIHDTSNLNKNPAQDPYKTRVNPVQKTSTNPAQDPYKTRVSENRNFRKPVHKPVYDPVQDPYKSRINPVQKIKNVQNLTGKQKVVFFYLLSDAKENGSSLDDGDRITSQIPSSELAKVAQTKNYEATRSVTNALKKANLVERYKSKDGPGGWTIYRVLKSVYIDGLNYLSRVNPAQDPYKTRVNPVHQPVHQPVQTASCSSSDLNISKNTTTTEPDFWLSVPNNLDGLVAVKQLREFVRQGLLSAEDLQTSLDGFAFDLEKGAIKAKNGNPVSILIGALKGGGYISQQYLSELKASLAEIEKARGELYKLQAENVAEQLKAEFESFREQFPEQAEKLKPTGKLMNSFQPGSIGYRMWLEEYKKNQAAKSDEAVL